MTAFAITIIIVALIGEGIQNWWAWLIPKRRSELLGKLQSTGFSLGKHEETGACLVGFTIIFIIVVSLGVYFPEARSFCIVLSIIVGFMHFLFFVGCITFDQHRYNQLLKEYKALEGT